MKSATASGLAHLVRYGLIGLLNTALSYGLYAGLLLLGLDYRVASFLSLASGIIWSFATMGRFVFAANLRGKFSRYLLVWVLLYLLNIGLIGALLKFGINAYWGGFIAAVPCIAAAYALQRFYVFRASAPH